MADPAPIKQYADMTEAERAAFKKRALSAPAPQPVNPSGKLYADMTPDERRAFERSVGISRPAGHNYGKG